MAHSESKETQNLRHRAPRSSAGGETDVDPIRRRIMQRVRQRDTLPELAVRRFLHQKRYRFRLHVDGLPGSPDIVLKKYRTVIFVHGCFWHRHQGCRRTTTPKTRHQFWQAKFSANVKRDAISNESLEALGWRVIVVWECQTTTVLGLTQSLKSLLEFQTKPQS